MNTEYFMRLVLSEAKEDAPYCTVIVIEFQAQAIKSDENSVSRG